MNEYRSLWQELVKVDLGKPDGINDGTYLLIGIIGGIRIITSKMGKEMAFAVLKDFNGEIGLVFFPVFWLKYGNRIRENEVVALTARFQKDNNSRRDFIVCGMQNINKLRQQAAFTLPGRRLKKAMNRGRKLRT